jgi:lysophospholipase L1-like esterase
MTLSQASRAAKPLLRIRLAAFAFGIALPLVLSEGLIELALSQPVLYERLPGGLKTALSHVYRRGVRQAVSLWPECARYDRELSYTLKPGACTMESREFTARYAINSQGLRDDEGSLVAPEIIALGDSYTMGWGVGNADTIPHLLERKTGRKVLNAGIASYGTARQAMLMDRLDLSAVKVVIVQYCTNDAGENRQLIEAGKLKIMSQAKYLAKSREHQRIVSYVPFQHVYYILKDTLTGLIVLAGEGPASAGPRLSPQQEAEDFFIILKRIAAKAPRARIIVYEMTTTKTPRREFIAAVNKLSTGAPDLGGRIQAVDVQSDLGKEHYFTIDEHLNAEGNRRVADRLLKALEHGF